MKNKKLNLEDLKVKSFVTDLKNNEVILTVKGGVTARVCHYSEIPCWTEQPK